MSTNTQPNKILSTLGTHEPHLTALFLGRPIHPQKVFYHLSIVTPLYSSGLSRTLSRWDLPKVLQLILAFIGKISILFFFETSNAYTF